MQSTPVILIAGGVEPQFEGDPDLPIWSLFLWRPADDDESADAATWSADEWLERWRRRRVPVHC